MVWLGVFVLLWLGVAPAGVGVCIPAGVVGRAPAGVPCIDARGPEGCCANVKRDATKKAPVKNSFLRIDRLQDLLERSRPGYPYVLAQRLSRQPTVGMQQLRNRSSVLRWDARPFHRWLLKDVDNGQKILSQAAKRGLPAMVMGDEVNGKYYEGRSAETATRG